MLAKALLAVDPTTCRFWSVSSLKIRCVICACLSHWHTYRMTLAPLLFSLFRNCCDNAYSTALIYCLAVYSNNESTRLFLRLAVLVLDNTNRFYVSKWFYCFNQSLNCFFMVLPVNWIENNPTLFKNWSGVWVLNLLTFKYNLLT